MAFTKAPEYNTHQSQIVPVGGSIKTFPLVETAGVDFTLKNLVIHKTDDGFGAVPIPPPVNDTAAAADITAYYTTGTYLCRAIHAPKNSGTATWNVAANTGTYVVIDDDLWSYLPGGAFSVLSANYFTTTNSDIGWTDYVVGDTRYVVSNEVVTVGGTNTIRLYEPSTLLTTTTTIDLGDSGLCDIVFLDGYLFALGGLTGQRIYNSTLGTPATWNTSTDYIDAETNGDVAVGMMRHHNHLVVWGTHTMEFFYNAGNELGSPLQRQANYAQSIGGFYDAYFKKTKVAINDDIYFAGGRGGHFLGIFKLSRFQVQKISPDWLDAVLTKSVGSDGLAGSYSYAPTLSPYRFGTKDGFVVTVSAASDNIAESFFFDPTTGVWSQLENLGNLRNYTIGETPYGTLMLPYSLDAASAATVFIVANDFYGDAGEGETPPGIVSQTGTWKTEALTFNLPNDKHIYSVEVVGVMPYNTVRLYVEEDTMHTGTINKIDLGYKIQSQKTYHQNPMIWRNIGRYRAPRFTVEITGQNSFRLGGLVVKYNQGTR